MSKFDRNDFMSSSNVYTLNTEKIRQQKTNNQNISDYRAYLYMGQAGVM